MILSKEEWASIEAAHAEQTKHNAEVEAYVEKMDELLGALYARAINECETKKQLRAFIKILPVGSFHRTELTIHLIKTFGSIFDSPSELT